MSTTQSLTDENKSRLAQHFSDDGPPASERWSALWDTGVVPWDQGLPNPALVDTIKARQDLVGQSTVIDEKGERRRRRALVPGCGRGYDVLLLASLGYDAYGLEVSAKAIEEARNWAEAHKGDFPAEEGVGAGEVMYVLGDFFEDKWLAEIGVESGFDLIYDYTFFCALSPTIRPAWAHRYTQLLSTHTSSAIICVEFPTSKPLSSGGPPFGVPSSAYEAHLSHPAVDIPYDDEGNPKSTGVDQGGKGFRRVGHWKAERTHEMGRDRDMVSVWKR